MSEPELQARPDPDPRRDVPIGIGLAGLVLAVFLPTLEFQFLNWDDPWYVVHNPLVKSWSPANLYRVATSVSVRNFAPLTIFSLLVDHTLWGEWAGGYHLTNVLLHALNTLLVYALVARLSGRPFVGLLTAALFAVHPVQVETVAWVSSRKGLLSATFVLASLSCWLRPDREAKHEGWGLLFLFLALLAKAIAVVVPPVVLLYDVWLRRRPLTEALPAQFPSAFLAFLLLAVTVSAQNTELGGVRDHMHLPTGYLLLLDTTLLWRYAAHLVWPVELSVLYDPPTTGIAREIALATLGWIAVAVVAHRLRHRFPLVPFSLTASLIFLLPVLNLIPITTLMNDRYLYLPCIGVFAVFAAGLERIAECGVRSAECRRWRRVPVWSAATVLVALAAWQTTVYLPTWRDGLALWTHAHERTPSLPVVRIQLANTLAEAGETERAAALLRGTLTELEPDAADVARIERKLAAWGP